MKGGVFGFPIEGGTTHFVAMLEVTAKLPRGIQQIGGRGVSVLFDLEATIVMVIIPVIMGHTTDI